MAKLLIAIPFYLSHDLHCEFTEKTVESIKTKHEYEVILVNNYSANEGLLKRIIGLENLHESLWVTENPLGNCVSAAWNLGIKAGIERKSDYILIPNNDIIFHPKAIDNLVDFAEKQPKEFILWTGAEHSNMRTIKTVEPTDSWDEHPHFSCFMVSPRTVKLLKKKEDRTSEPSPGYFDENFVPAYLEDACMHNRILRAGYKACKTASALFYHFGSRTIKVDEELYVKNKATHRECREYFYKKWGFNPDGVAIENDDPVRFKYKSPFNK